MRSLLWWDHGGSLLLSEPSAVSSGGVVHIYLTKQVHISQSTFHTNFCCGSHFIFQFHIHTSYMYIPPNKCIILNPHFTQIFGVIHINITPLTLDSELFLLHWCRTQCRECKQTQSQSDSPALKSYTHNCHNGRWCFVFLL